MKQFLLSFCLLLALTACGQQEVHEPVPPVEAPAQTAEPQEVPADPVPEQQPEPAAKPEPDVLPEPPVPALPDLPLPVYTVGDTAVDRTGAVLVQVPGQQLHVLCDGLTGQPRGLAALDESTSTISAVYDLTGKPLLQDLRAAYCGWYGDLFWAGEPGSYRVWAMSEQKLLYENMGRVAMAGDKLLLQPTFWNSSCLLLEPTGDIYLELERSFRLSQVFPQKDVTYLTIEAMDGRQSIIDSTGQTYLGRFYDEIVDLEGDHLLARDGSSWIVQEIYSAKILFQSSQPLQLVGEALLQQTGTPGQQRLLDLTGQPLRDGPLTDAIPMDKNLDGAADWILSKEVREEQHGAVVLDLQGQELLFLPEEPSAAAPVSEQLLFVTTPTGEASFYQEAVLHNLETGAVTPLMKGRFLTLELVQTSGEDLLLCRGQDKEDRPFCRLFTPEGNELLQKVPLTGYAGGDVFRTENGLICLDGTPLYTA